MKKRNEMRCFESLRIWQQAREIVADIYHLTQSVSDYGFNDQIRRAAVSVMNNIAEGSEYESDPAFIRFLRIAKGSCAEVKSMLYLCYDLKYAPKNDCAILQDKLTILSGGIYNMIKKIENLK